jgi:hypothetical protein
LYFLEDLWGQEGQSHFFLSLVISMQLQQLQINCLNEFFQPTNRQSDFTAVTAAVTAVTTARPSLAQIPDIQP